jgi:hypothetical protein
MQLAALALGACLGACDSRKPLPPPPAFAPGQAYAAGLSGASSARLLGRCRQMRARPAAALAAASDVQVVADLCRTLAEAEVLAARGDDPQQVCAAARNALEREFVQRFPRHDPNEANGRC